MNALDLTTYSYELLERIFKPLDDPQLARIKAVCRHWYNAICSNPHLYLRLAPYECLYQSKLHANACGQMEDYDRVLLEASLPLTREAAKRKFEAYERIIFGFIPALIGSLTTTFSMNVKKIVHAKIVFNDIPGAIATANRIPIGDIKRIAFLDIACAQPTDANIAKVQTFIETGNPVQNLLFLIQIARSLPPHDFTEAKAAARRFALPEEKNFALGEVVKGEAPFHPKDAISILTEEMDLTTYYFDELMPVLKMAAPESLRKIIEKVNDKIFLKAAAQIQLLKKDRNYKLEAINLTLAKIKTRDQCINFWLELLDVDPTKLAQLKAYDAKSDYTITHRIVGEQAKKSIKDAIKTIEELPSLENLSHTRKLCWLEIAKADRTRFKQALTAALIDQGAASSFCYRDFAQVALTHRSNLSKY